jgi:hypothetical protein
MAQANRCLQTLLCTEGRTANVQVSIAVQGAPR